MKIYGDYEKIIVAVTNYTYGGTKAHVIPRESVKQILENVFAHLPKIEVVLTEEGFPVRKTFDDLPRFDIVVTGNKATIENMKSLGIQTTYVPRTEGVGYSGDEVRSKFFAKDEVGVTVAIGLMRLKETFPEMADLHRIEIRNHEQIRVSALQKAKKVQERNPIYATILRLEAYRNLEHRKCHERMVSIYDGMGGL